MTDSFKVAPDIINPKNFTFENQLCLFTVDCYGVELLVRVTFIKMYSNLFTLIVVESKFYGVELVFNIVYLGLDINYYSHL